ncbi:uncharacterized protein LOC132658159 [Ovis aries]|uniref:uncharacterized protein LOC132658159 n=1 Tax=Ovis aries TaxID=9940 RepID=UPI002952841E|nr:uncharacterized protein LOC132658159 [Ovis aries]
MRERSWAWGALLSGEEAVEEEIRARPQRADRRRAARAVPAGGRETVLSVQETRHVPGRRVHACLAGSQDAVSGDVPTLICQSAPQADFGIWNWGTPCGVPRKKEQGKKKKKKEDLGTQELEKSFFPPVVAIKEFQVLLSSITCVPFYPGDSGASCLLADYLRRKPRCHQICDALCNPTVEDIFAVAVDMVDKDRPRSTAWSASRAPPALHHHLNVRAASPLPRPGRLRWLGEPPLSSLLFPRGETGISMTLR